MKICIPAAYQPKTGKGFFCQRLASELMTLGVDVIKNLNDPNDISLHVSKLREAKSTKRIYRIDGVIHNLKADIKGTNITIAQNLHGADGVVYQSQFSKAMCDKYLGKFDGPSVIILNGDNPDRFVHFKGFTIPESYCFVASSRWRPHKRLGDIIESFLLADVTDSGLVIAGDTKDCGLTDRQIDKYQQIDSLYFTGRIDELSLLPVYQQAIGMIHLCWLDCCPNSVVEAICAKCVPITNNVGGNPELSGPANGIVCQVDKPYNMEPVDLYSPPKIDRSIVAEAIRSVATEARSVDYSHVDITQTAKQYLRFFERVIDS